MKSAHARALQLQKTLFEGLKKEVDQLLGPTPKCIQSYDRENQTDFSKAKKTPRRLPATSHKALISAIRAADVTFVADFHTFDQAQRTALRIIREAIQPKENWLIGLELVPSQFQDVLDQFQTGQMSVEEFHQAISYSEEWGFPWENYAPIFEWARVHGVRLIALNQPKVIFVPENQSDLYLRDRWTAGILTDLFANAQSIDSNRLQMIVLYGGLHVGSAHLPAQLEKISAHFIKKPLKWVTVHQNDEHLYWKHAQAKADLGTETVRLRKNIYCIFSSPPWAKLQSVVSWTEGHLAQEADCLSLMKNYGQFLSEFLETPSPNFESLSVYSEGQTKNLERPDNLRVFSSVELNLIRFHLKHKKRLYLSKAHSAYLGFPTHNGIAELAAIHLHQTRARAKTFFEADLNSFYHSVLESAFGFLGSLILNPHRKCALLKTPDPDHPGFPGEFEAWTLAHRFLKVKPNAQRLSRLEAELVEDQLSKKRLLPTVVMGSRYLGQALGKKVHTALLEDKLSLEQVKRIFLRPGVFLDRCHELLQSF